MEVVSWPYSAISKSSCEKLNPDLEQGLDILITGFWEKNYNTTSFPLELNLIKHAKALLYLLH